MEGRLNANKTTSGVTIDLFTESRFVNRTMKEHHTTGSVSNSIISCRRGLPAGYPNRRAADAGRPPQILRPEITP
jgi:hypothetical protein